MRGKVDIDSACRWREWHAPLVLRVPQDERGGASSHGGCRANQSGKPDGGASTSLPAHGEGTRTMSGAGARIPGCQI